MMIKNNPVDLANKMLRFEKRAKAIRLLREGRRTPAIPFLVIAAAGIGFSFWVLRDRLPPGTMGITALLIVFMALVIRQLFDTQRQTQALVDLILLDFEETTEVENEQALQRLNEGKSDLKEAAR